MPYIMDEMGDNKKHVAVGRCKDPTIAVSFRHFFVKCEELGSSSSLESSGTYLANG